MVPVKAAIDPEIVGEAELYEAAPSVGQVLVVPAPSAAAEAALVSVHDVDNCFTV
jgi:hypothetical protein